MTDHSKHYSDKKDSLIAAIHREETPGVIADLTTRLKQLQVSQPAPIQSAEVAELTAIYDMFGIGAMARNIGTLTTSIRNVLHFADLLHAVEREFFMVPGEADPEFEGEEPDDECLVNCWGSTQSEYIEQFRAALARLATTPAQPIADVSAPTDDGAEIRAAYCKEYALPVDDIDYDCLQWTAFVSGFVAARAAAPVSGPSVWTCFHCSESFDTPEAARVHFGKSERQGPVCEIDAAKYREMEQRVTECAEEDSALHRQMCAMQSKHVQDLRREEEKGYARALKDTGYAELSAAPVSGQAAQEQAQYHELVRAAIVDLFQRMEKSYSAEPTRRITFMDLDAVFAHVKELGLGGCLDGAAVPAPLAAQEQAVPDGWALLPVDAPTAMILAIEAEIDSQLQASGLSPRQMQRQDGGCVYDAMLAAAPPAPTAQPLTDAEIEKHLDAVLRASGSGLQNYTMFKTLDAMRAAMRVAMTGATPARGEG